MTNIAMEALAIYPLGFNGILMGFYGGLMGLYGGLMGFNMINPLVN